METCLPSGRLCRLLTSLNLNNHSPRHQAFQVSRATAGTQMWLRNPGRASHAGDTEDRQARGLLAVLPLLSPYNRASPTRKGGPCPLPREEQGARGGRIWAPPAQRGSLSGLPPAPIPPLLPAACLSLLQLSAIAQQAQEPAPHGQHARWNPPSCWSFVKATR